MFEYAHPRVCRIRVARRKDVAPVALNLRQSDRDELAGSCGDSPERALLSSLALSRKKGAVTVDDFPVALFGVAPHPARREHGIVWYLATDRMDRECSRDLIRLSPAVVAWLGEGYTTIGNLVAADNLKSVRWLTWLGFHVAQALIVFRTGARRLAMVKRLRPGPPGGDLPFYSVPWRTI